MTAVACEGAGNCAGAAWEGGADGTADMGVGARHRRVPPATGRLGAAGLTVSPAQLHAERACMPFTRSWCRGLRFSVQGNMKCRMCAQDSSSLLGKMSLANVLRKRCGSSAQADSASHPPEDDAVQAGFADLALTGLALSDQVRQHDFAQQVQHFHSREFHPYMSVLRSAKQASGWHVLIVFVLPSLRCLLFADRASAAETGRRTQSSQAG